MQPLPHKLPSLPEIGYPEAYYSRRVKQADLLHDTHTREAYKVGQYVTLALAPTLDWDQKLRYFRHALRRHCCPPPLPSDDVWLFYQNLAELVRAHAGVEALKLAVREDEIYVRRLEMGSTRERIRPEAMQFFRKLLGDHEHCPEQFTQEDWDQLKMIRNQWV